MQIVVQSSGTGVSRAWSPTFLRRTMRECFGQAGVGRERVSRATEVLPGGGHEFSPVADVGSPVGYWVRGVTPVAGGGLSEPDSVAGVARGGAVVGVVV